MKNTGTFNVGDLISDSDQIYKIHKIDDGMIYYKPTTVEDRHSSLVCSIPMANASRAGVRSLLSKSDIESFFEYIKGLDISGTTVDYKSIKDVLSLNDPLKTAPVLKLLLSNKAGTANFTKTDEELLAKILDHLAQEMAMVSGVSPEKVKAKILGKK